MRILKFNESNNYFRIKGIIDNLNGILVEFNDNDIKYRIEPSNDIRVKLVSLNQIDYHGFYLEIKTLPTLPDLIDLVIDRIEMIVDYMDNEGFYTNIEMAYFTRKGKIGTINIDKEVITNIKNTLINGSDGKTITIYFVKKNRPVYEALPSDKTVDQLKKVMKLSSKTDIGNRISDMNKQGANIDYIHNPIETGIESREDYERHNKKFKPSWNLKHLIGPFDPEKNPKVDFNMDYKQKQDKVKK